MTFQAGWRHNKQPMPHNVKPYMDNEEMLAHEQHHGGYHSRSMMHKEQPPHGYGMRGADHHDNMTMRMDETDSDIGGVHDPRGVAAGDYGEMNVNDETSSVTSDKYERDVNVLNHCFDDIEKFIARLQHAAAASRELERRRRNRKSKKKDPDEGLLIMRTRPPHEKEFIDIFAKFKLSFNLLAKLKSHIHDPNAPELVHFLFTPLALVVEAASDTYYESQLPARVINPLLTQEAVNLLINCVTSKETELWRSLGEAWTVPRDQWKDDIGSYHPVFLDGWSPDYLIVDELSSSSNRRNHADNGRETVLDNMTGTMAASSQDSTAHNYDDYDDSAKYNTDHPIDTVDRSSEVVHTYHEQQQQPQTTKNHLNIGAHGSAADAMTAELKQNLFNRGMRPSVNHDNMMDQVNMPSTTAASQPVVNDMPSGAGIRSGDDHIIEQWLDDLHAAGAKLVLVTYPRTANNDKELSVVRGEYLEVLDDSRKWWKARNIHGQTGHVPHTIITPYTHFVHMETTRSQPVMYTSHHQRTTTTTTTNHNYTKSRNSSAEDNFDSSTSGSEHDNWIRESKYF